MPCNNAANHKVLELVQLFMSNVSTPPNGVFAEGASRDLMRFSLVCRTDHTQLCQLRAVSWRLRAEQALVAGFQRTLEMASDTITSLEEDKAVLFREIDDLDLELTRARAVNRGLPPPVARQAVLYRSHVRW